MLAEQSACPGGGSPGVPLWIAQMKKATRLSPSGFQDCPLMLAYASAKSESVTETELVAGRVLRGRRNVRGRVEGRAATHRQVSAVLVVDASHRCVQSRALRQVVHVAEG